MVNPQASGDHDTSGKPSAAPTTAVQGVMQQPPLENLG